ncbi:MAG: hypothetical protein GX088_00135 [Clostridia bacterium]|nr:hypothetical protein [Clostridia bacterium]
MIRDKILVGAAIGLLSDALKLIVNYISYLLGFTNVVFWQIVATRFLTIGDLFTPLAYIVGAVADIVVASTLGVIFFLLVERYGSRKYLWLKGIGFSMLVWVGLFGTLLGQSVQRKLPQNASGIMVTIVAHFVFGLGLAFFTRLYYALRAGEKV